MYRAKPRVIGDIYTKMDPTRFLDLIESRYGVIEVTR